MCIMYMMPGPSSDGEFNTINTMQLRLLSLLNSHKERVVTLHVHFHATTGDGEHCKTPVLSLFPTPRNVTPQVQYHPVNFNLHTRCLVCVIHLW
jgi:hypothetical protein